MTATSSGPASVPPVRWTPRVSGRRFSAILSINLAGTCRQGLNGIPPNRVATNPRACYRSDAPAADAAEMPESRTFRRLADVAVREGGCGSHDVGPSNVFFDDGTQATGSLTFDSVGSFVFDLSTWDVTVAQGVGGDIVFPLFTFNPADSDFTFTNAANLMDPEVLLFNQIFDHEFRIVLAGFTLPASGTLDLATKASPFVDGSGFHYSSSESIAPTVLFTYERSVVSGSLVLESTTGVPEPSTWILAGGVLRVALAAHGNASSLRKCSRVPQRLIGNVENGNSGVSLNVLGPLTTNCVPFEEVQAA